MGCVYLVRGQVLLYGVRQQGHAKVGSDWSLWLRMHVIATGDKANLEPDWSAKLSSLCSYTAMLHSCGKLNCHVTEQSWDLIGMWKFLSEGPRTLPKFTRPFSSLEVGSGDETTDRQVQNRVGIGLKQATLTFDPTKYVQIWNSHQYILKEAVKLWRLDISLTRYVIMLK